MRAFYLLLVMLGTTAPAFAQNAAAVINNVQPGSAVNSVDVQVTVSNTVNVTVFSTSFTMNFASSPNQTNADIKQRISTTLLGSFGLNIPVNNIVLFGGAQ